MDKYDFFCLEKRFGLTIHTVDVTDISGKAVAKNQPARVEDSEGRELSAKEFQDYVAIYRKAQKYDGICDRTGRWDQHPDYRGVIRPNTFYREHDICSWEENYFSPFSDFTTGRDPTPSWQDWLCHTNGDFNNVSGDNPYLNGEKNIND